MTVRCLDAAARAEHSRPAILLSMEPHPPDRGPGRIIFLNGASSSGKSTLAKAMQEALPEPFLHVSSDHLVASGMLPARRDPDGPFAWWQQMRPRFFDGFHRCLPALAAAGNDLIVEHIIEFRAWREYLAMLLDGLDVFLVGVHCELAEIDRRERDRGDRRIGEGRSHVETDLIHTFGPYDFEVDTTNAVPRAVAASVLAAWRAGTRRRALWQGISDSRGTLSDTCRYRHSPRQKRTTAVKVAMYKYTVRLNVRWTATGTAEGQRRQDSLITAHGAAAMRGSGRNSRPVMTAHNAVFWSGQSR